MKRPSLSRTRSGYLLAVLLCACKPLVAPVPLPSEVRSIAVLPPLNRTGDDLVVSGSSLLERYVLRSDRVTVPDVLAWEAQQQLAASGWTVADPATVEAAATPPPATAAEAAAIVRGAGLAASALFIEVRRCETEGVFQPSSVIVALALTLVDATDGRTLWKTDYPARPVATPGVANTGEAYILASQKVIKEALAPLVRS